MKYCDFHCDALTQTGAPQITRQTLIKGGCLFQCFAVFVSAGDKPYACANALIDEYNALCVREGYNPVRSYADLRHDKINALLTVEGGGILEGRAERLDELYERGVRIFGLLWNHANELGYPNFAEYENLGKGGSFAAREVRGLTDFGVEAVERMLALGMVPDCAHASDGVFSGVARICKEQGKPFVVTHTASGRIYDCARNLYDGQIKTVAESGGIVGLYFCADFLSRDISAAGQRTAIIEHARAMIKAGGEDVLVLGSDFDGIPPNSYLQDASATPKLYEDFKIAFGSRVADKIFFDNALSFLKRTL